MVVVTMLLYGRSITFLFKLNIFKYVKLAHEILSRGLVFNSFPCYHLILIDYQIEAFILKFLPVCRDVSDLAIAV